MGKRVRISNERLNSYGPRVLTSGMDVAQYSRNPVLLYMHERGEVIGYVKDVAVEGDEVTGELMFDEATELSRRCKKQWEFGSLKMVSAGLDILELSESPEHLVAGQTSPTITKSKLFEVSLVDIGANDDAIILRREGRQITMGKDSESPLPKLNIHKKKEGKEMEIKTIALQIGLPETATEAEVIRKLSELRAAGEKNAALEKEKSELELSQITMTVEAAIKEKKIGEEKKAQFVSLGQKLGLSDLKATLDAMMPQVKLSAIVEGGGEKSEPAKWTKLSEVPSEKLMELREKDAGEYKRLYKAEYGMECEI